MPPARLQHRLGLIATDKAALDPLLTWLSMRDRREALHPEKAQVGYIQAARRQVAERQWTALVIAPTLLQSQATQLSPQHVPAHEQLDGRLAGACAATTAAPHLGQFRGERDAGAVFQDHRTELLQQRNLHRLDLHLLGAEALQHALQ